LTKKTKFNEVNILNLQSNEKFLNLVRQINYYFSVNKKMSWSKYFCRINDFSQIKEIDRWICDRLRLCIFKKMNLKSRRVILDSDLREIGFVSIANWIFKARNLMYNRSAYQNRKV
jgi:hypothetical protein